MRAARIAALLLAASGAGAQASEFFRRPDLTAELTRIYNERDAPALHALLAPELRETHPPERIAGVLALCRALTHDILRLHAPTFPSMNARHAGFFAVEAETGLFELAIEVDPGSRIVHVLLFDDPAAPDQPCRIGGPGAPTGAR
jgi:hypothetical protein